MLNVIILYIIGCEKLAGFNNLCINESAGIIENIMTLKSGYIEDKYSKDIKTLKIRKETKELIGKGICLNISNQITEGEVLEKVILYIK